MTVKRRPTPNLGVAVIHTAIKTRYPTATELIRHAGWSLREADHYRKERRKITVELKRRLKRELRN